MNTRQEDKLSELQQERDELLQEEERLRGQLKEVQDSLRNNAIATMLWEHMDLELVASWSDELTLAQEESEEEDRVEFPKTLRSSSGIVKERKESVLDPEEEEDYELVDEEEEE